LAGIYGFALVGIELGCNATIQISLELRIAAFAHANDGRRDLFYDPQGSLGHESKSNALRREPLALWTSNGTTTGFRPHRGLLMLSATLLRFLNI